MAKLGDLVVRVGADTVPLNQALGNVKKTLRNETGNIQKLGRNMSMAITAPLVAIGATSFKIAADFEQSMAKVKAVSGATGEEFKSLEDNAKELGRSTRFTASEVSALQLEYAKLGFSANEITEVTEATLNLAQATGSDLAQSAEVAGATLRAFGLDASETGRVTDVMAASFSTSALDLDSFQDSMKFVAPVAKAAGVSLEEATAMLGQLANNGIKGSTAGTSLRRILQEIAGTGQPFAEAMKKSADEVINLADAKDEVGRTASSAFLVLKEGMGDVAGLTTELQGATGAASEMAAIMDDTAEGAMKRMQSAIEGAQIEIGTALAPIMIKLAGIVADLAQKFSTMSDGGQAVVFALSAVFGAIGPVLALLPSFTAGLKAAKLAFASLNMTMRANPFGVVATAIGLVVGAVIMLNNASSEGSSKVDDLKKSLGGLDLEQQKAAIEGAAISQKAYVAQLEEERQTIMKLAPYKRSANSQAGRDLKRLEASLETANADLTAMLGLEEGVAIKLKATADEASVAGENIETIGTKTKTTTDETRKLDQTLGFLFNKLEETPNENIWKPTEDGAKDLTQTLGHLFNKLEQMPTLDAGLSAAQQSLAEFNTNATSALNEAAANVAISFGQMLGSGKSAGEGFKGIGNSILGVFADLAITLGKYAIGYGVAIEKLKLAMKSLGGKLAIVAGIGLIAAGGIMKAAMARQATEATTAFADGGIVSGPVNALVGEYPGAKTNPEVIAPLDKLRGMLGGQNVQVTGKISGRDILLTSEMSAIDRNRVRGY